MMVPNRILPLLGLLLVGALPPSGSLEAQSILGSRGLGVLAEPIDAEGRALGSSGIGLAGWRVSDLDPAAAAGLRIPGISATFQPSTAELSDGRTAGQARFPTLTASFPLRAHVLSLRMGSFLDQDWQVSSFGTMVLGGREVQYSDQFRSSGNVARLRAGWAYRPLEWLSVGASVGTNVGAMDRSFLRLFSAEDVGLDVEPFLIQGRWRASGTLADVGVILDPSPAIRLAASVGWSSDLEFRPVGGVASDSASYAIPLEWRAGGTVTLLPGLLLHLSTTYADWSETRAHLASVESDGATWGYGGGVEWSRASFFGRTTPFRLGVRHRDLPFQGGDEPGQERTISAGVGLNLVQLEDIPMARIDLGYERGTRTGGGLSESFRRASLTLRISGG